MVETTFSKDSAPTFDPLLGFPNGRVARVLNATQVRDKREYSASHLQKILHLNSTTPRPGGNGGRAVESWPQELLCRPRHQSQGTVLTSDVDDGDKAEHDHHIRFPAQVCHYESWPFGFKCNHIRHEVEHCMR